MFFFKQKTAYEMRISDWSSDVCSSDLVIFPERLGMRIVEVEILFIDVQTPRCNEAFEISFSALQSDDLGRNALSLEVVRDRCREQRLAVFVSSEDTGEQPKVKASVQHIV